MINACRKINAETRLIELTNAYQINQYLIERLYIQASVSTVEIKSAYTLILLKTLRTLYNYS